MSNLSLFRVNSRNTAHRPMFRLALAGLSIAAVLLLIATALPTPVAGQAVNATVVGTVSDATGAPVANVKVTLTETNTNITRTVQTNDSGNYVAADLPPGTYRITAELTGFKKASKADVEIVV